MDIPGVGIPKGIVGGGMLLMVHIAALQRRKFRCRDPFSLK